jgi:hypothetical protein
MPEIAVGYEILVEVKVDEETGEVTDVVAFPEDMTSVQPVHVYAYEDSYLDEDDPRYKRAANIAGNVKVTDHDVHLGWTLLAENDRPPFGSDPSGFTRV